MKNIPAGTALVVASLLLNGLLPVSSQAQVSVLTQHNNNSRTGGNLDEVKLTTNNVQANRFGKLFAIPADGEIYAQPLYVSNLEIPGKGKRNVVFFATMNNSLYAHDADTGERFWCRNFGPPVPAADVQFCCTDISRSVGITGTPVIDPTTNRIYFVSRNKNADGSYHQFLNCHDIATGTPAPDSPREISGSSQGVTFDPKIQNQRPALTLSNGNIYIAWSSHNDGGLYHGWVMSYRASDLTQLAIFVNTPGDPNGKGGIWMAGQGLTVDASGNLYFVSGNGTYNADGSATGNSYTKLSPSLALLDWFTPFNSDDMNAADADLGSCGVLLIPDTQMIVGGSKDGVVYLLDSNNMGKFHSGFDQIAQEFQGVLGTGSSHIHGSPIYYNSPTKGPSILLWGENDVLRGFSFNTTTQRLNPTPYAVSAMTAPMANAFGAMPGGFLSLSSDHYTAGTSIVWASTPCEANANNAVVRGVLHAFNAETLKEVWSDKTNAARDEIGRFAKFCPPTIANGKVYIPNFGPLGAPDGSGQLVVYGLLTNNGLAVNCGGSGTNPFVADTGFTGGVIGSLPATTSINTSTVPSPPPTAIYRSWRRGNGTNSITYTISNLAPGSPYRLRLHFIEPEVNTVGSRRFNVALNGQPVLNNFDIFSVAAKRKNTAVLRQFDAVATPEGTVTLVFTPVAGQPLVCGIEVTTPTTINYNSGFTSSAGLTFNGSAKLDGIGPAAQLTDTGNGETGSFFTTNPVNVASFHTSFRFQLNAAQADGFTFTIQGVGPRALGNGAGGLGFETLPKSVGLKFDLWNNNGEGDSSIGLFLNGAQPTTPATNLAASNIDLHSGHPFSAMLDYNGTILRVVLQDTVTQARFTTSYTVKIPTVVGNSQAYVGFTGATGGAAAVQNIQNWNFTNEAVLR